MPFSLIFIEVWRWVAGTGINLALLIVLATLVPRGGRLANRYFERQIVETKDADEGKSTLAIAGVGIYIAQLVAYFLILVFFLQQLGFSLAGAAIPATVISAAVGFGSQQIIADFVAGFFILTEKQYGVGDLVTFQGSGVDVTGEVIQITMRATQVRTLEQYTVTIPNSTAKVCINNSNHWSRAVVVIPVPLLGSRDAEAVIARAESAAQRALENPDIAPFVRGELMSQPGLELNPPSTVGMPWTLDIRFMVRCTPGDQFPIERALRIFVLDEFFDEYGSATTAGGKVVGSLDEARAASFAPSYETKRYETSWGSAFDASLDAPTHTGDFATSVIGDSERQDATPPEYDPAAQEQRGEQDQPTQSGNEHGIGTLGGRVRASTGALIFLFIGLLLLRGLTLSAEEGSDVNSGVLAPPPVTTAPTTTPDSTGKATPSPTHEQPTQETRRNEQPTTTPAAPRDTQAPAPVEPTQRQEQPTQRQEDSQQNSRQDNRQDTRQDERPDSTPQPEGNQETDRGNNAAPATV